MRTVPVNASVKYNIYIDRGILSRAGEIVRETAGGGKAAVITDTNIDSLYADVLQKSLEENGYEVVKYVIPAGEEHKSFETLTGILSFMAEQHLSRKDTAIALGGGVVGDITGFAAAVYMRGIRFVQVPTTVLAAVDSSVGGKTAVDLPEGKNLAGAFYQPSAVICDCDTFDSLPERDFNNGFAEIIKYGMIADPTFFDDIDTDAPDMEAIVEKSVKVKAAVVEADEFEAGSRQLLNFGHTIGHAVEKASDFSIYHGEAVAIGMNLICRIAENESLCTEEGRELLLKAFERYGLPCECGFSAQEISRIMRMDKKASGSSVNLIMPRKPGVCEIKKTALDDLEKLLIPVLEG